MTPELVLTRKVAQLRWRLKLLVAQRWALLGLTAAGGAAAVLALLAWVRWLPGGREYILPLLGLGLLAGILFGLTRTLSPITVARLADERLKLQERLASGILFSSKPDRDAMEAEQIREAAERSDGVDPRQAFPWKLPRETRYCAASLGVLLLLIYLPAFLRSPQARAEEKALAASGKGLEEVARKIPEPKTGAPSTDRALKSLTKKVEELGKDQQRERVTKKEALLKSNRLMAAIKEAEQKAGVGPSARSLEKAAAEMKRQADRAATQGREQEAERLRRMATALEAGDMDAAARQLEQMARDLERMAAEGGADPEALRRQAESLRQMAEATSGTTAAGVSRDMSKAAEELARAAADMEKLQRELQQASSAEERAAIRKKMEERAAAGLRSAAST